MITKTMAALLVERAVIMTTMEKMWISKFREDFVSDELGETAKFLTRANQLGEGLADA